MILFTKIQALVGCAACQAREAARATSGRVRARTVGALAGWSDGCAGCFAVVQAALVPDLVPVTP